MVGWCEAKEGGIYVWGGAEWEPGCESGGRERASE